MIVIHSHPLLPHLSLFYALGNVTLESFEQRRAVTYPCSISLQYISRFNIFRLLSALRKFTYIYFCFNLNYRYSFLDCQDLFFHCGSTVYRREYMIFTNERSKTLFVSQGDLFSNSSNRNCGPNI